MCRSKGSSRFLFRLSLLVWFMTRFYDLQAFWIDNTEVSFSFRAKNAWNDISGLYHDAEVKFFSLL